MKKGKKTYTQYSYCYQLKMKTYSTATATSKWLHECLRHMAILYSTATVTNRFSLHLQCPPYSCSLGASEGRRFSEKSLRIRLKVLRSLKICKLRTFGKSLRGRRFTELALCGYLTHPSAAWPLKRLRHTALYARASRCTLCARSRRSKVLFTALASPISRMY